MLHQRDDLLNSSEIIVERESAIIENQRHRLRGLKSDHRNMSKLCRPDDPNYVAITSDIVRICKDIHSRRTECEVLFDSPNPSLEYVDGSVLTYFDI
jgi:hypothetical protein